MPPYTTLPRPAGQLRVSYGLMSPMNWGIVPAEFHIYVYPNVRVALKALLQAATTIHAQRLEKGTSALFSEHIYFRGHTDVTHRLLPTRMRIRLPQDEPRQRFSLADQTDEVREHEGDWVEQIKGRREVEELLSKLTNDEVRGRVELEASYLKRADAIPSCSGLSEFQKRAVVRHYSLAPSPLLDISTNPEVAAFFATGGGSKEQAPGSMGMLWGIDLNFFSDLFSFEISSVCGGLKIRLLEMRDSWGDNKQMFEEQGILPATFEITSVALPFRRPIAQSARFFALTGGEGVELPAQTELTWWSILERRAYVCAFIQDGNVYENRSLNITEDALLPGNEELASELR